MANVLTQEMFMRYLKAEKAFEWKITEEAEAVKVPEAKMADLYVQIKQTPQVGDTMVEIMKFLVDAAKKDPKGTWVSASASAIKKGQATV